MNRRVRPVAAGPETEPPTGDDARKRAIARAVWTEIHWLMPADRTVRIAVDGDAIAVVFGPPRPAAIPRATDRRRP